MYKTFTNMCFFQREVCKCPSEGLLISDIGEKIVSNYLLLTSGYKFVKKGSCNEWIVKSNTQFYILWYAYNVKGINKS